MSNSTSDVERLYNLLQGTFGGNVPWNILSLHSQQVFIQSVNNIRAICSISTDVNNGGYYAE